MLNTETLVRHCLVGAHAAGCAQAEPQTATEYYFESIFAILFDEKSHFLSILDNYWALFLFDHYQLFSDY